MAKVLRGPDDVSPLLDGASSDSGSTSAPGSTSVVANITIYWIFATLSLLSWFSLGIPRLFRISPQVVANPLTLAHLLASWVTVLCCASNHLGTPKALGDRWKKLHIYSGRVGAVASSAGAVFGELRVAQNYSRTGSYNYILAAVGVYQLWSTLSLVRGVKQAQQLKAQGMSDSDDFSVAMERHVYYTHVLFYAACLGPLWSRLFDVDDGNMGRYGRMVMVEWMNWSEDMCFWVFVGLQVILPSLLMSGSLRAKRRGSFV